MSQEREKRRPRCSFFSITIATAPLSLACLREELPLCPLLPPDIRRSTSQRTQRNQNQALERAASDAFAF